MRLNKIYINNYGIYNGQYEYDFSVTEGKNVILVSGRNGSGKTTLLNTVKLSIYGPKLFGSSTTQNKQYLSYIENNLNAFARHEGHTDYSVGIDFYMFYEESLKLIHITRSWNIFSSTLKESTLLSIDGQAVCDNDIPNILDYIHRHVPKALFDLFFFDGEKINDMFMLKSDLSDMLNHVYNLNLFLNLQKDLKAYRTQVSVKKELNEYQQRQTDIESRLGQIDDLITEHTTAIKNFSQTLEDLEDKLANSKESFRLLGGLNNTEQLKLKSIIADLERQKSEVESKYKELQELLPFIMLHPQLSSIVEQVHSENQSKDFVTFNRCFNSSELVSLLNSSFGKDLATQITNTINHFTSKQLDHSVVYDFTTKEEHQLEELWDLIEDYSYKNFEECVDRLADFNEQIRTANKKLEESANEDLKEQMTEIATLSNQVGSVNQDIENHRSQINTLINEKTSLNDELHKLTNELKNIHKEENLGNVIDKIENVISLYCNQIKKLKQNEFEHIVADMFNQLIRKDDFIKDIKVDPETGEIQLFNVLGLHLPKENLSAGEKQIYILSILFGIVSMSHNKVPLVFDTLLGRLDHAHKTHIINSFIKNCGEQVIILATDTEIDQEYLTLLDPIINNYYKIDYDSEKRTVSHIEMTRNLEGHYEL